MPGMPGHPSTTSSDPRSPMAKRNQTPAVESASYFATPATSSFSSIPVTPLGGAPPLSMPPSRASTTPKAAGQDPQYPTAGDQEMLNRFASYFPPPPALTLSTGRQSGLPDPRPQITTAHRARPQPPMTHNPVMDVLSSPQKHTFHVHLPTTIQPEMISISANRGDRLRVTAGAWSMESDCQFEWHINFPPRDVDMTSVVARFEGVGHLYIDARRYQSRI